MKEFIKSVLKAWETSQKTNATNNGENTFIEIQKDQKSCFEYNEVEKNRFFRINYFTQ